MASLREMFFFARGREAAKGTRIVLGVRDGNVGVPQDVSSSYFIVVRAVLNEFSSCESDLSI